MIPYYFKKLNDIFKLVIVLNIHLYNKLKDKNVSFTSINFPLEMIFTTLVKGSIKITIIKTITNFKCLKCNFA